MELYHKHFFVWNYLISIFSREFNPGNENSHSHEFNQKTNQAHLNLPKNSF